MRSVQKRPRTFLLPVRWQETLIYKRFITPLKIFIELEKLCKLHACNSVSEPTVMCRCSLISDAKQSRRGKESWKKKKRHLLCESKFSVSEM